MSPVAWRREQIHGGRRLTKGSIGESKGRAARVVFPPVPPGDFESAALGLTREAKNLYNTANFLVRQVATAFRKDPVTGVHVRIDDLHPNQCDAIVVFNRHADAINDKRRAKAAGKEKEPKLLARLEDRMTVSPLTVALDVTLLDNVVRDWRDCDGDVVYRRLPAASAQQVVRSVIDTWKASLAALKDWATSPGKYTGRPDFPRFLPKDGYYPLEIPFAAMTTGFPRPKALPDLPGLEFFYGHDLRSAVVASCKKRGWDSFTPQHVRLVEKGGRIRIEAVVAVAAAYPEGSFLKRMFEAHGDELRELKTERQRETFILSKVRDAVPGAKDALRVAGIDFGEGNVATAAFSTGHRAMIHSGERPWEVIGRYDALLDVMKAKLITPRLKELQAIQVDLAERNQRMERSLSIEMAREWRKVYGDLGYRRLVSRKERVKADFEHKISTDLVDRCVRNGIDVIVVGQNKGMKAGAGWGSQRNRSSHLFAHHRLLSLIRYKAERHGIAVVTTEESYTSKASFVDHDAMGVFDGSRKKENEPKETIVTDTGEDGASSESQTPGAVGRYSGHRPSSNRNWFIRRNAGAGGRSRVHADVNGAFNIIRKVFARFRYHVGLSLKFNVRWISPRMGAASPLSCPSG